MEQRCESKRGARGTPLLVSSFSREVQPSNAWERRGGEESLFREEIVGPTTPVNLEAWFQTLAGSLLPDNDEVFTPRTEKDAPQA